ncbi:MAG: DNA translocase FtsK 4TM domain-containing protein [Deltaproteobacteria bacterium]|nr:DNA translocase FtsK 4TM domain-containing protein [Deltaproteobacteria bacterium]
MARGKITKLTQENDTFPLKKEITAILLMAVAVFFYVCVCSFDPRDPTINTLASHETVLNLGGLIGAYIAGIFFFLIGGASYFLGLYFIINSILVFTGRRNKLKFLDFLVFIICSTFIAIFLQLQFSVFLYEEHWINAGGTIGKTLGEIGAKFLGMWGIYLLVVFGAILTFILATRLSFVDALNNSTVIIGKGMGTLGGRIFMYVARIQKALHKKIQERKAKKHLQKMQEAQYAAVTQPVMPEKSGKAPEEKTSPIQKIQQKIEDVFGEKEEGPKITPRKDSKPKKTTTQLDLQHIAEGYQLPPVNFLDYNDDDVIRVDKESLKMSARILEAKLKDFSIDGRVLEIHPGPVITMFEFQPAPGVKLSRINSLSDDLSMAIGGRPVRIISPLPNKAAIGIEMPNHTRETVWLKDIICNERFQKAGSQLVFALGKDTEGVPYISDLKKMPHLLIAGSTGSGKSVSVNTMICSILYKARPDEVRMIMIDPKMIELSLYEGIPHLLLPVVTDSQKANIALKWAVREMERRYTLLADVNSRNLSAYNKLMESGEYQSNQKEIEADKDPVVHEGKLPLIVIIIDEFADLMMVAPKEVEESVCRLAQKARAAGIHVILATQRPSVDVITGIIKANFPSRISFRVTSRHDSKTILDTVGAEDLLGMGDMLFIPPGSNRIDRMHGAFISEKEIIRIVDFIKAQSKAMYNEEILKEPEPGDAEFVNDALDDLYDAAVRVVCDSNRVSISSIQRHFRIGYNRAARLVEQMESQGLVSTPNGQGQREVLAARI